MIARHASVVSLLLVLFILTGCGRSPTVTPQLNTTQRQGGGENIMAAGSGDNIFLTQKLAEAYQAKTGAAVKIPASIGSLGAINAVGAGTLELGLISRPLTAQERDRGLKELPYARVAVVFAAHHDVPDTGLSAAEVLDILKGTKSIWSNGQRIYVFVREPGDSSCLLLNGQIAGFGEAMDEVYESRRWKIVYVYKDMVDSLKSTPGSFGFVNSIDATEANKIKPLALDGVAPTKENIASGEYKLVRELAFLYKGELSERAAAFVAFAFSPEGQQTIERWGATPVKR